MSYQKGAEYSRKFPGFVRNAVSQEMSPPKQPDMTAGAVSGVGRLEKIDKKPKDDAGKPQEV